MEKIIPEKKNNYHLTTSWYCPVCLNNKDYKVAGKHNHLNTQLHQRNVNITKDFLKLKNEIIELESEIEFLKPKKLLLKLHLIPLK